MSWVKEEGWVGIWALNEELEKGVSFLVVVVCLISQ